MNDIRKIAAIAAAAVLFTGCGKQTGSSTESDSSDDPAVSVSDVTESEAEPVTEADTDKPAQSGTATDPAEDPAIETTVISAPAAASTVTTTAAADSDADDAQTATVPAAEPSDGSFSYNSDGAIEVHGDDTELSDSEAIAAAQALYQSACRTQWDYTVGTPYSIDYDTYIENEYGWQYYLITESGINSLADVEADYYKVFSDRYPTPLYEEYIEQDGNVYALNGQRGSDIFYTYSQVTAVTSRTDDEIFFTVTSYYDGTAIGEDTSYTTEDEFSIVIGSDGVLRAGVFKLPY